MKKVTIISLLISIVVSLFGVCGYAADFKETSIMISTIMTRDSAAEADRMIIGIMHICKTRIKTILSPKNVIGSAVYMTVIKIPM